MAPDTLTEAPPETPDVDVSPAPAAPSAAAAAPANAKDAKKAGKDDKKGKGAGKDGKGKDAKGKAKHAGGEVSDADGPNVAAHPRAARAVARAKSWGGLIGFALGGYLSLPTNTLAGAGLRALIAGLVCYVAVWAGAVFVWRRLVILEIKSREQQLQAAVAVARARRELPAPSSERPPARANG